MLAAVLFCAANWAQTGAVKLSNTATAPTSLTVLDLSDVNDQGMLTPRVNQTGDITSPVEGLLVYQTQDPAGFYYFDGVNWISWTKPLHGAVDMAVGTTPLSGSGFTVSHAGLGRDIITYDQMVAAVPVVNISSGVIAGVPASYPDQFCNQVTGGCTTVQLNFVLLDYQNNGSVEFNTGTTNCAVVPGNRTSYNLTDPEWVMAPPTMNAGQSIRLRYQTDQTSHYVSIWGDWNGNGTFEVSEQVWSEPSNPVGSFTRNAIFPIPATACSGTTAIRLTVTDQADNGLGCDIPSTIAGETEEIQISINGAACTYQERQVACNVSSVNFNGFEVNCTDLGGSPVNGKYYFKVTDN